MSIYVIHAKTSRPCPALILLAARKMIRRLLCGETISLSSTDTHIGGNYSSEDHQADKTHLCTQSFHLEF